MQMIKQNIIVYIFLVYFDAVQHTKKMYTMMFCFIICKIYVPNKWKAGQYGNNINHKPVETSLNRFKPVLGVMIGYSQFKKCYCERTGDCSSCTQRTIDDSVAAAMSTCGGGTR